MKNKLIIKTVALLLITTTIFSLIGIVAYAKEGAKNWYFIKRGNCIPDFPDDAKFLGEHSCYYVDYSNSGQENKLIYLTFDAGYENGNIKKILDILKQKNVTATFFILSNIIEKNTELVKRMADEGHIVANHTKNHKDLSTLTDKEVEANLEYLEKLYYDKTGYTMSRFFRYPEGRYNKDRVLLLEKLGYKTVFWSMAHADWDDNRQPTANRALEKLMSFVHPGAVVLLHPTSRTNVEILPLFIDSLIEKGYKFESLETLVTNMSKD